MATRSTEEIRKLIACGAYAEALALCDEELAREPDNVEAILQKAWLLASPMPEVSDGVAGIRLLEEAAGRHPGDPDLHTALGQMYESGLGDYRKAVAAYTAALALQPHPRVYLAIALLAGAPGSGVDDREARRLLLEGLSAAPDDWQLHRELGTCCWRLGDVAGATAEYEAALKAVPRPDYQSEAQLKEWLVSLAQGVSFRDARARGRV